MRWVWRTVAAIVAAGVVGAFGTAAARPAVGYAGFAARTVAALPAPGPPRAAVTGAGDGSGESSDGDGRTDAERHRWRVMAQQVAGDAAVWNQVSALGADDVWVAGLTRYRAETSAGVPVVAHWDGATWRTHVFTDMTDVGDVNGLVAVGPDEVWLSVREYDAKRYLRFDGTDWVDVPTTGSGVWSSTVTAVAGEAWTVANARVVAHYDGTGWSKRPIAKHGRLAAISAAATDDVWAVGNAFDVDAGTLATRLRPLAKHWDGTRWHKTPVPVKHCSLTDVVAVASDLAWAQCVGRDANGAADSFRVVRWDGQRWTKVLGPVPSTSLDAFTATGDQVWLGGTEQMWHYDGENWTVRRLPSPQSPGVTFGGRDAYAMTALPGTDQAVAVGTAYIESTESTEPGKHPRRDVVWRSG